MSRYFLSLLGLALFVFAGCGGDSGPPIYPVTGALKIGGKDMSDIQVQFHPASGTGQMCTGNAKDGKYVLYSDAGKPGAPVGKYIVKLNDIGGGTDYMTSGDGGPPPETSARIPESYKPIEVEVKAESNTIDIIVE